MSITAAELTREYALALHDYLAEGDEAALQRAYELGRQTIAADLGVMELVRAHQAALTGLWSGKATGLSQCGVGSAECGMQIGEEKFRTANSELRIPDEGERATDCLRAWRLAGAFFTESLWPFEMMQRGFCQTNRKLRDLNGVLANRARELAGVNAELKKEIAQRKRVEQALRLSEANLRQLSTQILYAQEEERKRISRELHDEVGQALTAINMNLAMLRNQCAEQPVARKIGDVQGLLEQTMETIHNFTRELRPAMLDHLGLIPALRAYVRNFGKRTGLRVRFRAVPEVEELGLEEKTVLYRVTQEGLTNVVKHAQARQARVLIRRLNGSIRMEVQDDGKAFAGAANLSGKGKKRLGLLGIQERVRLVNGEFFLRSERGKGTTIRVQIPFKNSGAKSN